MKTYICFLLQTKNGAKAHKRLINSIQASFITYDTLYFLLLPFIIVNKIIFYKLIIIVNKIIFYEVMTTYYTYNTFNFWSITEKNTSCTRI